MPCLGKRRLGEKLRLSQNVHPPVATVPSTLGQVNPATNTYAPVERLRPLYEEALSHPQVVGLAIGTRPDCVPDEVLNLLESLAAQTYLSVEYGMQTMHDRSLDWMNRGHHHDAFLDAMDRSRSRGFEICAHVMLGLPGESHDDMLATARELARLEIDAVKIHNLYAVKDTPLAEQVQNGEVSLIGQSEYIHKLYQEAGLESSLHVIEGAGHGGPQFSDPTRYTRVKEFLDRHIKQAHAAD